MKIEIQTIPHKMQRYPTPGDYQTDENGNVTIKVSELGNNKSISEIAIALHELVENSLCRQAGILETDIDAFDVSFPDRSDANQYPEPGNCPDAPYHKQHMVALAIERAFVEASGLDWEEHDQLVLSLLD